MHRSPHSDPHGTLQPHGAGPVMLGVMFLSHLTRLTIVSWIVLSAAGLSPSNAGPKCGFETPVQTLKRATMVFTGRAVEVTDSGDTQTVTLIVRRITARRSFRIAGGAEGCVGKQRYFCFRVQRGSKYQLVFFPNDLLRRRCQRATKRKDRAQGRKFPRPPIAINLARLVVRYNEEG